MKNFKSLKKTFIIAEIGNNHEGSFKNAVKLIDKAKASGVDAVKFQTFNTNYYVNKKEKKRFFKLKKFELSKKDFKNLSIYTKKKGLKFISTPFDLESAKFLSNIVDAFKISSGDNNFYELIKLCGTFKKPLIISTGMIDLKEIRKILRMLVLINFPKKKLAFLHCVSDYPVQDKEANLLSISYLKNNLPCVIGYSDHVIGIESSLVAVSLGAKIVEKHFTLDNNFSNFRDHKISLDPKAFKKFTKEIKNLKNIFGNYSKELNLEEEKNLFAIRRKVLSNKNIKKGSKVKKNDLLIVRSKEKGLFASKFNIFLNKKLKKNIKKFENFELKHFIK